MPYDPHTISLEAELSTLPEHPYEDVARKQWCLDLWPSRDPRGIRFQTWCNATGHNRPFEH